MIIRRRPATISDRAEFLMRGANLGLIDGVFALKGRLNAKRLARTLRLGVRSSTFRETMILGAWFTEKLIDVVVPRQFFERLAQEPSRVPAVAGSPHHILMSLYTSAADVSCFLETARILQSSPPL